MHNLRQLEWFLSIQITQDKDICCLWLCQNSYIDKLTSKFYISIGKKAPRAPLLFEKLIKSTAEVMSQEIYVYQQHIGSINFAAVLTRPEIAHAALKLSEYLTNPLQYYLECTNRVFLYLAHTRNYSN